MNQSRKEIELEIGLIGGPEKCELVLHEYSGEWPSRYRAHANNIARALGSVALQVEHIGSTSVLGLAAKPIIDILLVVPDSGNEVSYLPALENSGYEIRVREPEFDEHRMVRTPEKDVHVHVFSVGSQEIDRYLVFRNHLRRNANDRARYEAVKRSLAKKDWADMNEYAKSKSEVIESIIAAGSREQEGNA